MLPSVGGSPEIDDSSVTFGLTDRYGRLAAVRLQQELGLDDPLDLTRTAASPGHPRRWSLRLAQPDVDRMEYLYEVEDHNGHRTTITDPANPLRAPGAFGDKSVVEFAGYRSPAWLEMPAVDAEESTFEIDAAELEDAIAVGVWSPAGLAADSPAPLIVAHDGPEYASLGGFTRYLATQIAARTLPPVRAVLLGPGDRNAWYSANDAYAAALCRTVLPEVDAAVPTTSRIGVGASLGGLAMLHAHRSHPGTFDALLLQSGSFFTPELDPQESGFSGFAAITEFVAQVHSASADAQPVPTVLTCGTLEENLANNRAMSTALQRLGYPARLVEVRDAHNYTAWRDALDPHLAGLVADATARAGDHAT